MFMAILTLTLESVLAVKTCKVLKLALPYIRSAAYYVITLQECISVTSGPDVRSSVMHMHGAVSLQWAYFLGIDIQFLTGDLHLNCQID